MLDDLTFEYDSFRFGTILTLHADCFEWLSRIPENSLHSIVTDPPYGVKEYNFDQIEKRTNGNGGVWRIPPSFDGSNRSPLPRFTALNSKERAALHRFFYEWGKVALHGLRPGGHVFIATLPLGRGIIADPFMGSGSTVAAAQALDLACVGVERYDEYFTMSRRTIPKLAALSIEAATEQLTLLLDD